MLAGLRAAPNGELYGSSVWKFSMAPSSAADGAVVLGPGAGRGREAARGRKVSGAAVTTDRAASRELPYHKFRAGDSVLITRFGASASKKRGGRGGEGSGGTASSHMEGAVLELRKGHLLVAVDHLDAEQLEAAGKVCVWGGGGRNGDSSCAGSNHLDAAQVDCSEGCLVGRRVPAMGLVVLPCSYPLSACM